MGSYLHWRTLRPDNTCWWCGEDTPQNLHHLFKRCPKWREQQRKLWTEVQEVTRDGQKITGRNPMPKVFTDWRCSQAILDFLADTEVGRSYPATTPHMAGGGHNPPDTDDEDNDGDSESEADDDDDEDRATPELTRIEDDDVGERSPGRAAAGMVGKRHLVIRSNNSGMLPGRAAAGMWASPGYSL